MNRQPQAAPSNYDRTENFVRAAKKSAKKEADAQRRSKQIFDYYRNKRK